MIGRSEWIAEMTEGKTVLDMGCVGSLVQLKESGLTLHSTIKKSAKSVIGIDLNATGINILKMWGDGEYHMADAEEFVSNPRVDVVVIGASLEHFYNPVKALRCAKESLKNDGELIITTPNARYFGIPFKQMHDPDHWFIWTPKMLSCLLKQLGFKIEKVVYFNPTGKRNILGWAYESLFLRFFPKYSPRFGILAIKK